MAHTEYSHYTDDELIRFVDNARSKSSLIDELATRLEKQMDQPKDKTWSEDCPVCKATFDCTISEDGDELTLEAS